MRAVTGRTATHFRLERRRGVAMIRKSGHQQDVGASGGRLSDLPANAGCERWELGAIALTLLGGSLATENSVQP